MVEALIVLGGAALLVFCRWSWLGRSRRARWWLGDRVDERSVIFVLPMLGTWLFIGGVATYVPINTVTSFLIVPPLFVTFFWGFYGMLAFLPIPKFLYPKWARK